MPKRVNRKSSPEGSERPETDRLERYRAKRSPDRTVEPIAVEGPARPGLFVVQKHAARRTHYDFRLERGGVLWSWAVPYGPSADPKEKRLAVHVEDHPIEYADFEGIIPEGNYGAGAVIAWDRGVWIPYEDPDEGIQSGKLHFELRGYKLRGVWTLIRLKGSDKDWLLIKKADTWAGKDGEPYPEESILSGLTVEELRDGKTRAAEIVEELSRLEAPRRPVDASTVGLMLAETAEAPFTKPGWLFELKFDGYRLIAARRPDGSAQLISRNGNDLTAGYPEIARAVKALPYDGVVMDGEVVVLDEQGRPVFQRLQQRSRLQRRSDIERAAVAHPATLFVFDLLGFQDFDLRSLPLVRRKELLRRVLPSTGALRFADHVEERGQELFDQVQKLGLEGVIAKKADVPYRSGRSPHWLKVVADRVGDFVVVGFTRPRGSRSGFGSLHLAVHDGEKLVYAGRAGTGFSAEQLAEFHSQLEPMVQESPPCAGNVPKGKEHVWVTPKWVAEVRYKEWTDEGLLRHPVFVRLRDDKRIEECVRPGASVAPEPEPEPEPRVTAREQPEADRTVRFTNLNKVFWPDERYTKKDLIDYYRDAAPWLLPYLVDRPVVLTRYPDGIAGKSFYQKNAPGFVPEWIRRVSIWSEHSEREIEYVVCDNLETLLYLANMGTIPLHIWSSRVATLQQPDWCIIDLDPKGAPFAHVVRLARATRDLCEDIGLPAFIKSSGSTGLHVLVPLGRQCTYEQSRMLGNLLARVINDEQPEISTTARSLSARGGKVYLDFLQNRHGQLLVAPFSVRPLPGAPVSTPLEWSEVDSRLAPERFTIRTVPERMKKRKEDPLRPVLDLKPDLATALGRLSERLERTESPVRRRPPEGAGRGRAKREGRSPKAGR